MNETEFDRSKPFWSLILTLNVTLHGNTDVLSRVITKKIRKLNNDLSHSELVDYSSFDLNRFIDQGLTTELLEGGISLGSSVRDDINLYLEVLENEFDSYYLLLVADLINIPLRMLVISAYEITKDEHYSNDPLWQFFRHVRNASAHNNKFTFTKNEPRYPALWRSKSISRDLAGTHLFNSDPSMKPDSKNFFLMPADILLMLNDIEKKYIK